MTKPSSITARAPIAPAADARSPQPPTPPTLERSLRLAVAALHKQAHASRATPETFEAHIYVLAPNSPGSLATFNTYHQLRQAADILQEQADDAQTARRADTLSKATVKL